MQRGIALPTILILGVISMVFIATIYYFLSREIRITGATPVFMSVRDATYSAADFAIGRIERQRDTNNPFIDPCEGEGRNPTYTERIRFRLKGGQDVLTSTISIKCLLRSRRDQLGGQVYDLYLISVETCRWNSIANRCSEDAEYYKVKVIYPY